MSSDECARPLPLGRESAGGLMARLAETGPAPLSVVIGLTERCNLQCTHCFSIARSQGELSTDQWKGVIHQLAEFGVLFLTFTGGEVGLRLDLEDLVAHAAKQRFVVKMKTNGTRISEGRALALRAAGLRHMQVSVYHTDAGEHDAFVGRSGAWHESVTAARAFRRAGGDVTLANVAMGWNAANISAWIHWCVQEGFGYLVDSNVDCRNDGNCDAAGLRLDDQALAVLLQDPRLADLEALGRTRRGRARDSGLCMAGRNGPYVNPRGDVQLCQRLPMVLGSVLERPFAQIWESAPERQRFLGHRWGDVRECSECDLSWICQRCPADALLEDGDLLGPSRLACRKAQVLAALIGKQ